eukprot:6812749-Prymnesium_polylepis.1
MRGQHKAGLRLTRPSDMQATFELRGCRMHGMPLAHDCALIVQARTMCFNGAQGGGLAERVKLSTLTDRWRCHPRQPLQRHTRVVVNQHKQVQKQVAMVVIQHTEGSIVLTPVTTSFLPMVQSKGRAVRWTSARSGG